jgi:diadenosine tetraphosphatase ApaH/serine/threonine PP2A family protein phosphatase
MRPGASWSALFPRLHRDETARWQAFAWLETNAVQVAFHGHTHVQMVHAWDATTRRVRTTTQEHQLALQPATRYIIGVGSAGAPDDGPHLRYAIYDAATTTVWLRRLSH